MKRNLIPALALSIFCAVGHLSAAPAQRSTEGTTKAAKAARGADSLRTKQDAQQRARSMARELMSSILEIQLAQLQENGLEKLPIYTEISSMRQNIDKLVENEMLGVVEILVQAQSAAPAE